MAEPTTTVADVMRTDVLTVAPGDAIATVARLLAEQNLPGVPVVEGGEIVGIVTEADLIAREADVTAPTVVPFFDALLVGDAGRDFDEDVRRALAVTAGELMTSPVYNIKASATLAQLASLMLDRRVNPVPVVDDDRNLVGIVSRADLIRLIARQESTADPSPPAPSG